MIRVCLVEDQALVRQGIQTLLSLVDDIDVVAEASDGDEAVEIIAKVRPDVVLLAHQDGSSNRPGAHRPDRP